MSWIMSRRPITACSQRRRSASALLGVDGDHVVALRRSHSLACVLLAIYLLLHKEMSLLFQVDVAVRTGVALGVTELVSQLHHHPPEEEKTQTRFHLSRHGMASGLKMTGIVSLMVREVLKAHYVSNSTTHLYPLTGHLIVKEKGISLHFFQLLS